MKLRGNRFKNHMTPKRKKQNKRQQQTEQDSSASLKLDSSYDFTCRGNCSEKAIIQ